MDNRRFKPGDRVRLRSAKQPMEVLKYVTKRHPVFGYYLSENEVKCVWFEHGNRRTGVFHQNRLTKVSQPVGLFVSKELKINPTQPMV